MSSAQRIIFLRKPIPLLGVDSARINIGFALEAMRA